MDFFNWIFDIRLIIIEQNWKYQLWSDFNKIWTNFRAMSIFEKSKTIDLKYITYNWRVSIQVAKIH